MISLIVILLFGLSIAYFAMQNTLGITINLGGYRLTGMPLYFLVIASVLLGIIMAGIIDTIGSMGTYFAIRFKDKLITQKQNTINNLQQQIHTLEVENARLRGEHQVADEPEPVVDKEEQTYQHDPTFFHNLWHSLSRP